MHCAYLLQQTPTDAAEREVEGFFSAPAWVHATLGKEPRTGSVNRNLHGPLKLFVLYEPVPAGSRNKQSQSMRLGGSCSDKWSMSTSVLSLGNTHDTSAKTCSRKKLATSTAANRNPAAACFESATSSMEANRPKDHRLMADLTVTATLRLSGPTRHEMSRRTSRFQFLQHTSTDDSRNSSV